MRVLALAAPPGTSARAVPLLQLVGHGIDVVSWQQCQHPGGPSPDAVLATTVDALAGLPAVAVAVWADSADDVAAAARAGAAAVLCRRPELVELGAVLVPPVGIDLKRWSPIAPVVRERWRARHGLPSELVVGGALPSDGDELAGVLAVASVAVLTGPTAALALALGTPLVTNPVSAQRLGIRPGVDAEVTQTGDEAAARARSLAGDVRTCAVLSRRGRRFAERHLDLSRPAAVVRERLGLAAAPVASCLDVATARLDELATPLTAPIRHRLSVAVSPLTAGARS